MAPSVKCLPCKLEDLSLVPGIHVKKTPLVWWIVHINPGAGEVETGSHRDSLADLLGKLQPMRDPVSKQNKRWLMLEELTPPQRLSFDPHVCTHVPLT